MFSDLLMPVGRFSAPQPRSFLAALTSCVTRPFGLWTVAGNYKSEQGEPYFHLPYKGPLGRLLPHPAGRWSWRE